MAFFYSQNWFDNDIPNLRKALSEFSGVKADFLEIGSFEGRSTVWFLTEILNHPQSSITCIDWFKGSPEHYDDNIDLQNLEEIFNHNIAESGSAKKVTKIVGKSQQILRNLPINHFDAAYIDGSHKASDVLEDAVLSFRLLKTGGILMFDDYEWPKSIPETEKPKMGIDAFLSVYHGQYELIHKAEQLYIRKIFCE